MLCMHLGLSTVLTDSSVRLFSYAVSTARDMSVFLSFPVRQRCKTVHYQSNGTSDRLLLNVVVCVCVCTYFVNLSLLENFSGPRMYSGKTFNGNGKEKDFNESSVLECCFLFM
jgi:hypothetical protein